MDTLSPITIMLGSVEEGGLGGPGVHTCVDGAVVALGSTHTALYWPVVWHVVPLGQHDCGPPPGQQVALGRLQHPTPERDMKMGQHVVPDGHAVFEEGGQTEGSSTFQYANASQRSAVNAASATVTRAMLSITVCAREESWRGVNLDAVVL